MLNEENALVLARLALPCFGLQEDAPLEFVKLRENCVFQVSDDSGPVALRRHRPGYRAAEEIVAESDFIAALGEGLPIAGLIPCGPSRYARH